MHSKTTTYSESKSLQLADTFNTSLDCKQESKRLAFKAPGWANNLTLLTNHYILFQTEKDEQIIIHIYNKQKNQIIDEITVNSSDISSNYSGVSPFVKLPRLGFITLLQNSFLIWDGETNQSQRKPVYSEEKDEIEITSINNIFFHEDDQATFYCTISIPAKNIRRQFALLSINLSTFYYKIRMLKISFMYDEEDHKEIPATQKNTYSDYSPPLRLYIFLDGQVLLVDQNIYDPRYRSDEQALFAGYVDEKGNIHVMKRITTLDYHVENIVASPDGRFIAMSGKTSSYQQYKLSIYCATSLYNWDKHSSWICNFSYEIVNFLSDNKIVCSTSSYQSFLRDSHLSLDVFDLDTPTANWVPLLPKPAKEESESNYREYFSNGYSLRIQQKGASNFCPDHYITSISTYYFETKKDTLIKQQLEINGLGIATIDACILEYAKDMVMFKPFFNLPEGIGLNLCLPSKATSVNQEYSQHSMFKHPQKQNDKKQETASATEQKKQVDEKNSQQSRPVPSSKGSCSIM